MKRIFLFTIIFVTGLVAHAQKLDVKYKVYGSNYTIAVIQPTVENFIKLLSLSEREFEACMKRYKYFEEDSQGKYRSFWNGSLDNFTYAECVNTFMINVMIQEVRFMVSYDYVYPSNAITSLFRELKPFYKATRPDMDGNSIDYFSFVNQGYTYEFYITTRPTLYDIQVKSKLANNK